SIERRWSEAEATVLLAAWRRSGLSLAVFARQRGFQAQRLAWWHKRLSGRSSSRDLVPATFVPGVVVEAESRRGVVATVRLARGGVVELAEVTPAFLATLAAELDERP